MKLTKGVIDRAEAVRLASDYVAFVEKGAGSKRFEKVDRAFSKVKKNRAVVTFHEGQYIRCRVCHVERDSYQAVDGPVVRVTNGEYSWRVDGCDWAYPIQGGNESYKH